MQTRRRSRLLEGLGRNVVVLGMVSSLTDISSEMLYPIVPFVYGAACALAAGLRATPLCNQLRPVRPW